MECLKRLRPLFLPPRPLLPFYFTQHCLCSRSENVNRPQSKRATLDTFKTQLSSGPTFQDFVKGIDVNKTLLVSEEDDGPHAYLSEDLDMGNDRKGQFLFLGLNTFGWAQVNALSNECVVITVCFETYGCQMNVNDTEIAWSVLQKKGYQRTNDPYEVHILHLHTESYIIIVCWHF